MEETVSPYYPPRARWYGRVLYPWFAVQRLLHLDRIHLPSGVSVFQFMLSLVLPGYAFFTNGRRVLGWSVLAAYGFGWLIFAVALGYSIGNLGFGLIVGAHATSIVFLQGYWLRDYCRLRFRFALAVITLLAVSLAVYWPMVHFVEARWLMPLGMEDRVVIVSRARSPKSLKRGDWAAYRVSGSGERGVYVRDGFVLGPVLAVGGDRVEFGIDRFKVNGLARPSLPHMPRSGEVSVPENHWFLWPNYAITGGHGEVNEAIVSGLFLQMATVSEDKFVGTPYRWWFWRHQISR